VLYEFGVDREKHIRTGERLLESALAGVPFFWNQLAVLRRQEDSDFVTEPGLIELRGKAAAALSAMADAVGQGAPVRTGTAEDLQNPAVLESERYAEYARNTIAGVKALEERLVQLQEPNRAAG